MDPTSATNSLSLGDAVRQKGPLPIGVACERMRLAALGLKHLCDRGLIHGDVRPDNLPVTGKAADLLGAETAVFVPGHPDYLAPERANDRAAGDIRSDVYSLGCSLYFLLAGQVPFVGGTAKEKVLRHQLEEPTPLECLRPGLPSQVVAIVRCLMAKSPAERYQTPGEVAAALAPFASTSESNIWSAATLDYRGRSSIGQMTCIVPPYHRPADERPTQRPSGHGTDSFIGRRIGPYEIRSKLGSGGMGSVFLAARLDDYQQQVAIKMLRSGHVSDELIERFHSERQLLAGLNHPHIGRLLDGGATEDGLPYLVMEYIAGQPLDDYCKAHLLPTRDRLQLFVAVCEAVQYAHQQTVVHRDLKPSNVLVTKEGMPKVVDFGLAKRVPGEMGSSASGESSDLTHTGAILGTPSYMAPEQAGGQSARVGPAADVYALGAILYELLTGRPPFRADTVLETMMQARNDDPVPPRKLQPNLARDLETICLKCLQKQPDKRYPSAAGLVVDVRHYLDGEPILARPVGLSERTVKWVRRRPLVTALLSAIVLVTAIGMGAFAWAFGEVLVARDDALTARDEAITDRKQAEQDRQTAQIQTAFADAERMLADAAKKEKEIQLLRAESWLYASQFREANNHFQDHDLIRCRLALAETRPDFRGPEYGCLVNQLEKQARTLFRHQTQVTRLALSRDGKRLVSASADKTVKVWDLEASKEIRTLSESVSSLALSGDGKRIFLGSGEINNGMMMGTVKVWDLNANKEPLTLREHQGPVTSLALSADGKRLVSGSADKTIKVWNLETGKVAITLPGHAGAVLTMVLSSDGKRLYSGASGDRGIKVWDLEAGKEVNTLAGHEKWVGGLALGRDDKRLVSVGGDQIIKVWDLEAGKEIRTLRGHSRRITSLALSGDGKRLFSASEGRNTRGPGEIKVWDLEAGRETATLRGHIIAVISLALSDDGKRLVSSGGDPWGPEPGEIKVWDLEAAGETVTLHGHTGGVSSLVPSGDGKRLFSGGSRAFSDRKVTIDGTIKVWDLKAGQEAFTLGRHAREVRSLALSRDGKRLVSLSGDAKASEIKVWNMQNRDAFSLRGPLGPVSGMALSGDGKRLFLGSVVTNKGLMTGVIKVWDLDANKEVLTLRGHKGPVTSMAVSADGKRLVSGNTGTEAGLGRPPAGEIKVWDVEAGKEAFTLRPPGQMITSLVLGGDGKRLVAGGTPILRVWDLETGKETQTLRGLASMVTSMVLSADGKRLFSGGIVFDENARRPSGEIKVWDLETGKELITLRGHSSHVTSLALSRDGKWLYSGSADKTIKVWSLAAGQ